MARLSVELDPDVEQMIDNWRSVQVKALNRIPSKKEAINILLKEALKRFDQDMKTIQQIEEAKKK